MPTDTAFARLHRLVNRVLAVALAASLGACAVPPVAPPAPAAAPVAPAVTDTAQAASYVYRVSPGDELSFRFFYAPTLNTLVTVRSDGRVALPLAGELVASGLTLAELGARVEVALAPSVRRPQVTVNVQGTGAQRVFVGGEVGKPGVQALLGPLTLLQAVLVAEGLKDTAQARNALVIRRGPRGERVVLPVDLSAAMSGADSAQDLPLQAFDVVVVPKSGVADLNLWVDQYIRRMLPFSAGFSYTINRNGVVQ